MGNNKPKTMAIIQAERFRRHLMGTRKVITLLQIGVDGAPLAHGASAMEAKLVGSANLEPGRRPRASPGCPLRPMGGCPASAASAPGASVDARRRSWITTWPMAPAAPVDAGAICVRG